MPINSAPKKFHFIETHLLCIWNHPSESFADFRWCTTPSPANHSDGSEGFDANYARQVGSGRRARHFKVPEVGKR